MPANKQDLPEDFIVPLYMNGLEGRMLYMPSKKRPNREILLIYGHHAVLERWWGLVENLNQYGNVTMPDLPGFGGMERFSKIGIHPNIDAYADYLASFIKLKYKRKTITIYAISFGFVVITRMLQRHPYLVGKVDLLVSAAGFMHRDDFVYTPPQRAFYRLVTRTFATLPVSLFIRYFCLNRLVVEGLSLIIPHTKARRIENGKSGFKEAMAFETKLWKVNDVRTHWLTTTEFLGIDNCQKMIDLEVVHLVSAGDVYFNNINVEQHMRRVFSSYKRFALLSEAHVPSVIADKKAMAVMVPLGLRRILNKKTKSKV